VLVPDKKPDIDNILKAIFDSLNGYAFADDVQIVQVYAEKQYADEPFLEVEIDELR
jgi:Holliday junction resolvase RusA-like endonuclease